MAVTQRLVESTKNIILFIIPNLRRNWIFIIYAMLVIIAPLYILSWMNCIVFYVYSFVLFIILYYILKERGLSKKSEFSIAEKETKFFIYLLIFSLFFLLITRFIPFFRFGEAPLGYDTGFHIRALRAITTPEKLVTTQVFYLFLAPFRFLGLSPLFVFDFSQIFSQFLIVGSLYFLFRSLNFSSSFRLASVAVLLFSTSLIQFLGYWWVFAQQMLAVSFFLLTIALFLRQSPLMILTGAITFLIHTATAAPLGISFSFFFLIYLGQLFFRKNYLSRRLFFIFGIGFLFFGFIFLLKSDYLLMQLGVFLKFRGLLENVPVWRKSALRGLFIDSSYFRFLILPLLPLGLFGVLYPRTWIKDRLTYQFWFEFFFIFYIIFLVLFVLAFFPVIYQARFGIIFSLILIIFATPPLLLLMNYFLRDKIGRFFLALFLMVFFAGTGLSVWNQQPMIFKEELDEIKALTIKAEQDAWVMVTDSRYTPWVYGFFKGMSITPGLMEDDWDLSTWIDFWKGESDEGRLRLLGARPSPLYLFLGDQQPRDWPFQKFIRNDPHFIQISPHTWKFNPQFQS